MLKFTFSLCALLSIAFCSSASENSVRKASNESQIIEKDVQQRASASNDDMETFPIIEDRLLAEGCGCGKGKNKNLTCCGEEELNPNQESCTHVEFACSKCGGKHFASAP